MPCTADSEVTQGSREVTVTPVLRWWTSCYSVISVLFYLHGQHGPDRIVIAYLPDADRNPGQRLRQLCFLIRDCRRRVPHDVPHGLPADGGRVAVLGFAVLRPHLSPGAGPHLRRQLGGVQRGGLDHLAG